MKASALLIFTITVFTLSSCYKHTSKITRIDKDEDSTGIYLVDYDAIRRGTIIIKDSGGNVRFVAEPPPDAAVQVANSFKNGLSAKGVSDSMSNQYNETINKLYERSTSVTVLRDALYRISEIKANIGKENIDSTTVQLFKEVLAVVKEIEINKGKAIEAQVNAIETKQQEIQLQKLKVQQGDINVEKAIDLERSGFNALMKKDLETALLSFEEANKEYPTYHNVYDIAKILRKHKKSGNIDWDEIYKEIYPSKSWGMPEDVKEFLKENIKK
jgi:hypothetical protein